MNAWPPVHIDAPLETLRAATLVQLQDRLAEAHHALRRSPLELDVTRGKPSPRQLDLSNALLGELRSFQTRDGGDARNYYGSSQGLPEVREIFQEMLGAPARDIVIANNSSLSLMHDVLSFAMLFGVGHGPWLHRQAPTFLCPSPGYDRHFSLCEGFGIHMIRVPLTGAGPDMRTVRELVRNENVAGIWCVPQYSNPTGETYSAEVVRELASMATAAPDFRIFWDNAYAVHHLTDDRPMLPNILQQCAVAGNPDRAFIFGSTSKMTFAGSGLGLFASSSANVHWLLDRVARRTIGPDKINQLRHLALLRSADGIVEHMKLHQAILAPKFSATISALDRCLGRAGIARWTTPTGGYFISLDVPDGCASRVVELAGQAGVKLVPAGRTYPYGNDPRDSNLRIAPSYPEASEVSSAAEVISLCTALAWLERRLGPPQR